jgi:hypothetical protein
MQQVFRNEDMVVAQAGMTHPRGSQGKPAKYRNCLRLLPFKPS